MLRCMRRRSANSSRSARRRPTRRCWRRRRGCSPARLRGGADARNRRRSGRVDGRVLSLLHRQAGRSSWRWWRSTCSSRHDEVMARLHARAVRSRHGSADRRAGAIGGAPSTWSSTCCSTSAPRRRRSSGSTWPCRTARSRGAATCAPSTRRTGLRGADALIDGGRAARGRARSRGGGAGHRHRRRRGGGRARRAAAVERAGAQRRGGQDGAARHAATATCSARPRLPAPPRQRPKARPARRKR